MSTTSSTEEVFGDRVRLVARSNSVQTARGCQITLSWLAVGFVVMFGFMISIFLYVRVDYSDAPNPVVTGITPGSTESTGESTYPSTTTSRLQCSSVSDVGKLDCSPDGPVTHEKCLGRGCCYTNAKLAAHNPANSLGIPQCYYPAEYVGYKVNYETCTSKGLDATMERVVPSGFPDDVKLLNVNVSYINQNTLRIKITDSANERFQVPFHKPVAVSEVQDKDRLYDASLSPDGILSVTRRSSGINIFSTDLSYLVYSDQFIQLSTKLPSRYIYGLGEHYTALLKDINWTRLTFFNKDNFPGPRLNLYGSHPFYLCLENGNKSHGLLLLNSNAMDVVLQPLPAVTFRPIGGILDFFLFLGPSPHSVVQQYARLVGLPFLPPYWSLGFHLSKYGYNSVNETRKVYLRTRNADVPYDVQWNDIDYMDRNNDFTYDRVNFRELPEFVHELHDAGMHYVLMFDPGVSNTEVPGTYPPYDEGLEDDVFVKNNTDGIFVGKVWNPVSTVFPDFTHPKATSYWTRQFKYFHDKIHFDGAWIDMNEISNFYYNGTVDGCPKNSSLEDPPYLPGGRDPLCTQTLCMTAKHYSTVHYNEHNLHGYREAIATNIAMRHVTGKRPFVISRASFPGQGHFSGHWSGDIASTWEDMRYSVINMLNFNLYGIPMVGSDICGFRLSTTSELCARWFALGAFYPFARNHNDIKRVEQDPAALGEEVLNSARNNLLTRYSLLPYLYYLFYRSHVFGEAVVQPLFFEFTNDPQTYGIDEQFMWGPSLMVIPALYEGVKEVVAYLPEDTWYDFYTGQKRVSSGDKFTLPAPLDKTNLAVRSGSILVLQYPNTTTTQSRLKDFMVYVALKRERHIVGELYWDDGDSIGSYENQEYNLIQFRFQNNTLRNEVLHSGYSTTMTLGLIRFFGLDSAPKDVSLNGGNHSYHWDEKYNCLDLEISSISLLEPFSVALN